MSSSYRSRAVPVLVLAVLATSWGAPFVRLATAPPLAIAAWRLAIATLLLTPVALSPARRAEWRGLTARAAWGVVAAGAALAVHFGAWIASVRLTSVAASSALVALSPVFAWLMSTAFLGERPTPRQAAGILLAVAGAAVIAVGGVRGGSTRALEGDGLALVGAVSSALYLVIGRRLRVGMSLAAYVTPVYAVAAVLLLAAAGTHGQAFAPYPPREWVIFAALAVVPMIIGHTGLNFALRFFPAFVVGVAALGDPVVATLIAWLLPAIGEAPGFLDAAGGMLCLLGIGLTLAGAPRPAAR
jgi:drug/metabolite transporter (DMT)-like permease